MTTEPGEVTKSLTKAGEGDSEALKRVMPLIYGELRARAAAYMARERPDHTLQPTALVHEAYLRLSDPQQASWKSRSHFFALAARTMRRILVENARARRATKRGGERDRVPLDEEILCVGSSRVDLVELDEALEKLEEFDSGLRQIVEMRIFAGMSVDEVAGVLEVDPRTVKRRWRVAKTFLYDLLAGGE